MQLQRRYNLPNCTLLLDGLADTTGEVGYSQRLGVLMNLDCYLSGDSEPISGGTDFLMSLMNAVSHYAQQCLSGVLHPQTQMAPSPVRIHSLAVDQHELQVYDGAAQEPQRRILLNTVQFFDLVEALDQLLADPLTLPQLTLPLSPLSRQDAAARQPIIERAGAPTIGIASLATAATLFFFAPIPDIQRPLVDPVPGQESTSEQSQTTAQPTPTGEPAGNGSTYTREALLDLNAKIYKQVDNAWVEPPDFQENLTYRVSVNAEGEIRGYRADNDRSARYESNTPLPELLTIAPEGTEEELTDFKVVLTPQGRIEVNPWHGFPQDPIVSPQGADSSNPGNTSSTTAPTTSPTVSPTVSPSDSASETSMAEPITDPNILKDMTEKLYKQLDDRWVTSPSFDAPVIFRFKVDEAGQVLDFQPASSNGSQYLTELGFASLKANTPTPASGHAEFRVVFTPKGVVEVSPWDGF